MAEKEKAKPSDLFTMEEPKQEEKPLEDLKEIKEDLKAKEAEGPKAEERPPRKRRRKKKPEAPPEAGPMIEPDLMNMFILAVTSIFAKFLGGNWVAKPQELPMLSKATDRWLGHHFPGIMETYGPDVEMVTAWGLYAVNRIEIPEGMVAPPEGAPPEKETATEKPPETPPEGTPPEALQKELKPPKGKEKARPKAGTYGKQ